MSDPIADLLIRIKNGYMAQKEKVVVPYSKLREEIVKVLSKEGYTGETKLERETKVKRFLTLELVYEDKKPKLTEVVRVSKPGRRVYVKKEEIPKVLGGLGIAIISTSKGIMTDREARKKNLGGELICKIW